MLDMANQDTITMVVIKEKDWADLKSSLQDIKELIIQKKNDELADEWIPSEKARKMLGVSTKTWQTYRDKRIIPFSQRGRKIYISRRDINEYMESHLVKSRDAAKADSGDTTITSGRKTRVERR